MRKLDNVVINWRTHVNSTSYRLDCSMCGEEIVSGTIVLGGFSAGDMTTQIVMHIVQRHPMELADVGA